MTFIVLKIVLFVLAIGIALVCSRLTRQQETFIEKISQSFLPAMAMSALVLGGLFVYSAVSGNADTTFQYLERCTGVFLSIVLVLTGLTTYQDTKYYH